MKNNIYKIKKKYYILLYMYYINEFNYFFT